MSNYSEKERQLNSLIFELASVESKKELSIIALSLDEIYKDKEFRHKYSVLFFIVNKIANEENYDIDILSDKIVQLENYIDEQHCKDNNLFQDSHVRIGKLIDHLNLEIARCNNNSKIVNSIERNLSLSKGLINSYEVLSNDLKKEREKLSSFQVELLEAKQSLKETEERATKAEERLQEADKKIESSKAELISILSIFAAIVLAASGGLTLLGGAFSSLKDSELLKSSLIALICGLVLFNIIFGLIYTVSKMIGKNLFSNCSQRRCVEKKKQCNGIIRLRKRLPYIFWGNILIVFLILICISLIILDNFLCFMPY